MCATFSAAVSHGARPSVQLMKVQDITLAECAHQIPVEDACDSEQSMIGIHNGLPYILCPGMLWGTYSIELSHPNPSLFIQPYWSVHRGRRLQVTFKMYEGN